MDFIPLQLRKIMLESRMKDIFIVGQQQEKIFSFGLTNRNLTRWCDYIFQLNALIFPVLTIETHSVAG